MWMKKKVCAIYRTRYFQKFLSVDTSLFSHWSVSSDIEKWQFQKKASAKMIASVKKK